MVQDGGFEAGDFAYWNLIGSDAGYYNFVDDGTYTGLTPYSGTYYAALGEVGSLAYLSQTLPTRAGQPYLLSFWLQCSDLGYRHDYSQPIHRAVERLHPDQHRQCGCVRLDGI